MARVRTYKTEGVVLKQTPLGEADRILVLYTPDMGKVRAVAKGVRRGKSRLAGHLELLNLTSVSVSQGRSLDVVREAEVIDSRRALREDLQRLSKGLYLAELVDSFSVEQSANHVLYRTLLTTLHWLETTDESDLLLRHFELHLLDSSGYRPELDSCVACRSPLEADDHLFDCGSGGVVCPSCRASSTGALLPASLNAMKVLRFLQREPDFARVVGLKMPGSVSSEIERLLRANLRFLIERELKSAEFMGLVASADRP